MAEVQHPSTTAVHAGLGGEPVTGAIQPPVFQTSTFVQRGFADHAGYEYARTHQPTREVLEGAVAALETPAGWPGPLVQAVAFASGMASISAVSELLEQGDHIIAVDDLYGGTVRLFDQVLSRHGIETTYDGLPEVDVDAAAPDLDGARAALARLARPSTRLLWLESPTNPLLRLHDLAALCTAAHERGILVGVDSTLASPALQQPLAHGADLVVHSTTKYIGGHSDVVGGIVVSADTAIIDRLRFLQNAVGAVPAPWDCFLILRGLRTLPLRMERHSRNAGMLACRLLEHPPVTRVLHPGLPTHRGHACAARQMHDFGGMISVELDGGLEVACRFAASLRLFPTAESLGGVESLLNHPWTMTHASIPEPQRLAAGLTPGLIRLSVGIEHAEDLWRDLATALDALTAA